MLAAVWLLHPLLLQSMQVVCSSARFVKQGRGSPHMLAAAWLLHRQAHTLVMNSQWRLCWLLCCPCWHMQAGSQQFSFRVAAKRDCLLSCRQTCMICTKRSSSHPTSWQRMWRTI